MPKEQAPPGEAVRGASKLAKERSNSAALRARRAGGSEKDSGYSEAGSDDQRSSKSEPHRGGSKPSNMAPYEDLTPIYVFKNLLVKPSGADQLLHGPLSWAGGWPSLSCGKAPTQVLLIQQPVLPPPPASTLTPPSCPAAGKSFHSSKSSYLPILNSYPRIAPHPRRESNDARGSVWGGGAKESEGQSQSKRVCTEEEKREAGSVTGPLQREVRGGPAASSSQSGRGPSAPDSVGSPSISSSQTPSPPSSSSSSPSSSSAHSSRPPMPDSTSTRHRRFLNTAEILTQSGLLAITLRTKELLKQSAATERELLQLRQHTQLLCSAARDAHAARDANLHKLFRDMEQSGSYPHLEPRHLRGLSGDQAGQGEEKENQARTARVVSVCNLDQGTSPPSPLFAPSPEPASTSASFPDSILDRQLMARDERKGSPMMFPESSTTFLL